MRERSSERGSATMEITLLTPLLLMFLLLVVLAGRTITTKLDVDAATSDAARAASLERDPTAAQAAALVTVNANVAADTKACRTVTANVDTTEFQSGGSVSVDVVCTVDFSDLSLLRLGGSWTVHSHETEPIDVFKAVSHA